MKYNVGFAWMMAGLLVVGCGKQPSSSTPQTEQTIATSAPPAAVAVTPDAPPAQGLARYIAQGRGSKIKIEGDSSVHKWTMEGTIIGGFVELDSPVDFALATIPGVKNGKINAKVKASIPVRTLKSGHDIMDKLYQEALKEPSFPKIEYSLTEMTLKGGHVAGKPFEFDTKGLLSFAGVTNAVSIPVKMEGTNTSKLKIVGSCPLKMTAFGIKPPAPNIGMGLMRCYDDVNIVFEWTVAMPAPTAPTAAK